MRNDTHIQDILGLREELWKTILLTMLVGGGKLEIYVFIDGGVELKVGGKQVMLATDMDEASLIKWANEVKAKELACVSMYRTPQGEKWTLSIHEPK